MLDAVFYISGNYLWDVIWQNLSKLKCMNQYNNSRAEKLQQIYLYQYANINSVVFDGVKIKFF